MLALRRLVPNVKSLSVTLDQYNSRTKESKVYIRSRPFHPAQGATHHIRTVSLTRPAHPPPVLRTTTGKTHNHKHINSLTLLSMSFHTLADLQHAHSFDTAVAAVIAHLLKSRTQTRGLTLTS